MSRSYRAKTTRHRQHAQRRCHNVWLVYAKKWTGRKRWCEGKRRRRKEKARGKGQGSTIYFLGPLDVPSFHRLLRKLVLLLVIHRMVFVVSARPTSASVTSSASTTSSLEAALLLVRLAALVVLPTLPLDDATLLVSSSSCMSATCMAASANTKSVDHGHAAAGEWTGDEEEDIRLS